jgi:peptide/nickel transport system permease protein
MVARAKEAVTEARATLGGGLGVHRGRSGSRAFARLRRSGTGVAGLVVIGAILGLALLWPVVRPSDPNAIDLLRRLHPPAWVAGGDPGHVLGTDPIGRDVLSRIIFGARVSVAVGLLAVGISTLVGVALGLTAGYVGGWLDDVVMRAADAQLAFPFILLAIAIIGVLGPTLPNVVAVLALSGWVQFARITRSEVLSLRQRAFVEAARAAGARDLTILGRHLLPNLLPSTIILATLELGRVIILESGLSFLGLGVPPPTVTWGGMLADGRNYVREAWWLSVFPGCALMILVLAINLAGDALRDALDPSLVTE